MMRNTLNSLFKYCGINSEVEPCPGDAVEKVEEVTSATAEPDDSPLSKQLSKKSEIKINKLDLQEAKSSEGSKVDLGGLMSRYPGLLLAASKDAKENEMEALGSPTEPEESRNRRNRRSSDMSAATNKDEISGGSFMKRQEKESFF